MEVALIGGCQRTALRVIRAAVTAEATIQFASANFSQQRCDAAAVDKDGKIYYGSIPLMHNKTSKRLDRNCFLRVEEQLDIDYF